MRSCCAAALPALAFLLAAASLPAQAATRGEGELAGIRYRYRVPDAVQPGGAPLVVVLHGCRQGAEDIRAVTRFDALGDEAGFATLYPETGPGPANPLGCWVWWDPENQTRGQGEPAAVVAMVERVRRETDIDASRVYLAGLSSGGAMAAILGALYPDVFAAIGVHSGLAYGAAATAACAAGAMRAGAPDPAGRGEIAYHAQGARHRELPVIVVHGEADATVRPVNAEAIVTQFARSSDLADDGVANASVDALAERRADERAADGRAYEIADYEDADGRVLMRAVRVDGLGHGWSGGAPSRAFSDPGGPDATRAMWEFFRRWSLRDPASRVDPPAECRERYGWNFAHFAWHRRMTYAEYACDPWRATWRRSFDGAWGPGRCP